MVYRGIHGQSCQLQGFLNTEAVKLHPGVLPGMVLVRKVGVDLFRINQEPFSAFNLVGVGHALGIRGYEGACAGYAVVEQIVVPGVGTVGVQRFTLFPAVLI